MKDLWFLAGITASKQKDWRSARFCFGHCDDDIRKLEALILVNFCEQNFLGKNFFNFIFDLMGLAGKTSFVVKNIFGSVGKCYVFFLLEVAGSTPTVWKFFLFLKFFYFYKK